MTAPAPEQPECMPIARIIAVGSGKGGVGKSTVAVNLAVALAGQRHRVGLLDADLSGPDVGVMLGARRRRAVAPGRVMVPVERTAPLAPEERYPTVERYGVRAFSIGMLIGEGQAVMLDGRFIGHLVRRFIRDVAWGALDILLLDLPPGMAEPHGTLVHERLVQGVIVVTTPQEIAQIDAARFVRFFEAARVPVLGSILNMSYFECPDCGGRHAIWPRRDVPDGALQTPILAEIPITPAIAEAGDRGRPVVVAHPTSLAAHAFGAAARRVWECIEALGL